MRSMSDQASPTPRNLRLTAPSAARPGNDDQLSTELDAIITIGRALSHIPDADTRSRVMRWAIDRFGIDVAPVADTVDNLELPETRVPAAGNPAATAESLNV